METSFKTCVFGGFDREDVISYIRKTAEESQKKLEALMEETERLRVRCETAESELSALRTRSAELEQQLADTEVLRAEAERLRTEEETLRRENETLRGPAAQYQSLKDHIADIEISAHRRTEEFRGKAIAELMELVDGQRRWCTQQEAAYRQMNEASWPSCGRRSAVWRSVTWGISSSSRSPCVSWRRPSTVGNEPRRDLIRGRKP